MRIRKLDQKEQNIYLNNAEKEKRIKKKDTRVLLTSDIEDRLTWDYHLVGNKLYEVEFEEINHRSMLRNIYEVDVREFLKKFKNKYKINRLNELKEIYKNQNLQTFFAK